MADYSSSKPGFGQALPDGAVDAAWTRVEPLITPDDLRFQHLFGIPLVSNLKDPITGKPQVMTDEFLKRLIDRAVAMVESDTLLDIFPVQYQERKEFDISAFRSWGFFSLEHAPAQSVEKLEILLANGQSVYTVSQEWIETGLLHKGQISIIPMGAAISAGGVTPSSPGNGAAFLAILGGHTWVPAYWAVTYTTGFKDGMVPKIINELIGTVASIEALGLLAATNSKATSHSLGIGGLSQSVGGPGPDLYTKRIDQLTQKKDQILHKLKTMFGNNIFASHI